MSYFREGQMPNLLITVQVNGRRLGQIEVPIDEWVLPTEDDKIRTMALALDRVVEELDGRDPDRVVVVPGRLVNIIVD